MDEKISRTVNLSSAYLAPASFYSCPVCRLDRKAGRWYNEWTTNEWMAGWMTNLSSKKKKRASMHIRMIMNKMKAEDNIKNKTKTKTSNWFVA